MEVEEFLGHINYAKEYKKFESFLLSGNEEIYSLAFVTLYGILTISENDMEAHNRIESNLMTFIAKMPYLEIQVSERILIELHNIVRSVIIHNVEYIDILVETLSRCYDKYNNADRAKSKHDLDGMYNVSSLSKTLYLEIQKKSMHISDDFLNLINNLKANKLNEVRGKWENCST